MVLYEEVRAYMIEWTKNQFSQSWALGALDILKNLNCPGIFWEKKNYHCMRLVLCSITKHRNSLFILYVQLEEILLNLTSDMKMETTYDAIKVSLLLGTMLDGAEDVSTSALVSFPWALNTLRNFIFKEAPWGFAQY